MTDLLAAFAGGKLLRLYFVNGIRRVGKSTLMYQLMARCDQEVLPVLLNLEIILADPNMNTVKFVRRLISDTLREVQIQQNIILPTMEIPSADAFELESPWVIFDGFLANLLLQTQCKGVLICFDEVQRLVERIADHRDPIDDSFLSWLRSKIQAKSNILVVCTGSEPYAVMRRRYERHTLWGNMEAYNVSFVEKAAMEKIATQPVIRDGVVWPPEALDRLWDMTEGHPWLTQILAEKVAEQLNVERRRLVGPADVERAAASEASDERISDLWWNEREGMVTETHRQIAFLILQRQVGNRLGLPESQLVDYCQKSGIRTVGKYLEEMRNLEVLTEVKYADEAHWRIKGAFLEQHLTTLMHRFSQEIEPRPLHLSEQPLALMLDWENVKIGLQKLLGKEPYKSKADSLRPRLNGAELAKHLLDIASRHGKPRQRWAVANWDRFRGDQMALKNLRYMTDIAGVDKADASDHVLRERIHDVLSNYQEINSYIIGTGDADFGEVINTLIGKEKHVVLWTTKDSMSSAYRQYLSDPDYFQIEWLEDLIFEEESSD